MDDKLTTNTVDGAATDGFAIIEAGTPLSRLHYFDGKFLRADALTAEQDYSRTLVRLSNLASGWGAVHGYELREERGVLVVGGGLATTPRGNLVLLNAEARVAIDTLVKQATPAATVAEAAATGGQRGGEFARCGESTPAVEETAGLVFYLVTIAPWQRMCGNEEVYGKLCEDACVTDTQRPWWREGVIVRLRPISLALPLSSTVVLGNVHLRNRAAAAYFALEAAAIAPMINRAGLRSEVWCQPARVSMQDELAIGMLARSGASTAFLDAWSARRERMDTQARGYWQARMMMRPWNVFVAQILQFQCQLAGLFRGDGTFLVPPDECARVREVLATSAKQITLLRARYQESAARLFAMVEARHQAEASAAFDASAQEIHKLGDALNEMQWSSTPMVSDRMLLNGGFVELPSAGYLPVLPGDQTVNEQMRRMFGEGVNLHFCTCRPDYIAHAVEQAQHMQRISLTRGLDDPAQKEEVEIFVPDGEMITDETAALGAHWLIDMDASVVDMFNATAGVRLRDPPPDNTEIVNRTDAVPLRMVGVARTSNTSDGGAGLTFVCEPAEKLADNLAVSRARTPGIAALYIDLRINRDPFTVARGEAMQVALELRNIETALGASGAGIVIEGNVCSGNGTLSVEDTAQAAGGPVLVHATIPVSRQVISNPPTPPLQDLEVDVTLTLVRTGNARDGTVSIEPQIASARIRAQWVAQWSRTPRVATFSLAAVDARLAGVPAAAPPLQPAEIAATTHGNVESDMRRAFVRMQETAAALPVDDPVRVAAIDALNGIGLATNDTAFVKRATDRLFPDAQSGGQSDRIRAKQDWVMFRRQRKADCAEAVVPVPPEPPRPKPKARFKVWYLEGARVQDANRACDLLRRDDFPSMENTREIDIVDFVGDAASPEQTQQQLLSDWAGIADGDLVCAGVWPRQSAPTANAINLARLGAVAAAIGSKLVPVSGFSPSALNNAPAGLDFGDASGGMLFIGVRRQVERAILHRVLFAQANTEQRMQLMRILDAGGPREFMARIEAMLSVTVPFTDADHPNVARFREASDFRRQIETQGQLIGASLQLVLRSSAERDVHRRICDFVFSKLGLPPAQDVREVEDVDFGDGAASVTVVFVRKTTDRSVRPRKTPAKHR